MGTVGRLAISNHIVLGGAPARSTLRPAAPPAGRRLPPLRAAAVSGGDRPLRRWPRALDAHDRAGGVRVPQNGRAAGGRMPVSHSRPLRLDNELHWHNSGLWDMVPDGAGGFTRVLNQGYAQELSRARELLAGVGCV